MKLNKRLVYKRGWYVGNRHAEFSRKRWKRDRMVRLFGTLMLSSGMLAETPSAVSVSIWES